MKQLSYAAGGNL